MEPIEITIDDQDLEVRWSYYVRNWRINGRFRDLRAEAAVFAIRVLLQGPPSDGMYYEDEPEYAARKALLEATP